jgi:phage terminase large subunit-like protein
MEMATDVQVTPAFTRTPKQRAAIDLMNEHAHTLLMGGSRSGKSFVIMRQIFMRGLKAPGSNHLVVRQTYSAARRSLINETVPDVLRVCFPGIQCEFNGLDSRYRFRLSEDQEWSTLTVAGIDSSSGLERLLGTEYSTVWANEISEIKFAAIEVLWTRLAESSGLKLRMYYDQNPTTVSHYSHGLFVKGVLPTGEPWDVDYVIWQMNPVDNSDNIAPEYFAVLKGLSRAQRKRFLLGEWGSGTEGAMFTMEDIVRAQSKDVSDDDIIRTVVACDPAVTGGPKSDATGIIVISLTQGGALVVEADYTVQGSPLKWAQAVVKAYHDWDANYVVAEVNQGGDLVTLNIQGVDRNVKVVTVRASKGKAARAEPVAAAYEQGLVAHSPGLDALEDELMTWVPSGNQPSPNRLDALVWGAYDLKIRNQKKRIHIGDLS